MINLTINSGLMIGLTLGVVLFIVIMAVIVMYKDRKKDQEEINELVSDLRKDRKEKEVIEELEKDIEKQELIEPEIINEQQEEKDKTPEFEEKKVEIEQVLAKMQKDLDNEPETVVSNFEQEQEEKAIISYQELVASIKDKSPKTEIVDDELEYRKNKSLQQELKNTIEIIENQDKKELINDIDQDIQELKKETEAVKKFKQTDFISPVYGKMNEHLEYPTVPSFEKQEETEKNISEYLEEFDLKNNLEINTLEQTLDMPPISNEIKKNDEFLQALKEFRKNLD